eukprot:scaffold1580_cov116-Cylindrotheca_fusiformis.AAC.21
MGIRGEQPAKTQDSYRFSGLSSIFTSLFPQKGSHADMLCDVGSAARLAPGSEEDTWRISRGRNHFLVPYCTLLGIGLALYWKKVWNP